MFEEPGHAYVYFTYGMYHCLNCVTESVGSGTAVLVRAVEPLEGMAQMRENRSAFRQTKVAPLDDQLANGPGKLCAAFGLTRQHNRLDLTGDELWLEEAPLLSSDTVGTSARVGISRGRELPFRFYDSASLSVTAHPKY